MKKKSKYSVLDNLYKQSVDKKASPKSFLSKTLNVDGLKENMFKRKDLNNTYAKDESWNGSFNKEANTPADKEVLASA